jgi:hypothetical protein
VVAKIGFGGAPHLQHAGEARGSSVKRLAGVIRDRRTPSGALNEAAQKFMRAKGRA